LNSPPSSQIVKANKPSNKQSVTEPNQQLDSPLTLSQALIITAGLAGLIGLIGGGVMRFSLSKSSNARFLSPLQTFPALSNWSSTSSSSTATEDTFEGDRVRENDAWENSDLDSWGNKANSNGQTRQDSDEYFGDFGSESFTDANRSRELRLEEPAQFSESGANFTNGTVAPGDFDSFANRAEGQSRAKKDPFESLSEGPLLRKTEFDKSFDSDATNDDDYDDSFSEENLSEERF